MKLSDLVQTRYTTKAFDSNKKISTADMEQIKTLLRFTPSSTNLQPWHFVVASTPQGKATVAKSTQGYFIFNEPKIVNASHVVVLCSKVDLDESHLLKVLDVDYASGRIGSEEKKKEQHLLRKWFADTHRFEMHDMQAWLDKQIYIALGNLLLGAAMLGIDACPMEGFDVRALNSELELREKGLSASLIVALGYRADDDFNAKLPKSRLPVSDIITEI